MGVSWKDKKKTGRDHKPDINGITRDFQKACHLGADYDTFLIHTTQAYNQWELMCAELAPSPLHFTLTMLALS